MKKTKVKLKEIQKIRADLGFYCKVLKVRDKIKKKKKLLFIVFSLTTKEKDVEVITFQL